MRLFRYYLLLPFMLISLYTSTTFGQIESIDDYAWVYPTTNNEFTPIWGHLDGIRVGIAPMPGPGGLLRIYTPYLEQRENDIMNFIAFEPTVTGDQNRGFSELEKSKYDNKQGKYFWSSNDSIYLVTEPYQTPAKGVIEKNNNEERLTVYIFSEPFENGAQVYVRLRFYQNKPYEIELTTYAAHKSATLESFILTATMGNYARLRTLYLSDTIKSSLDIWPSYRGDFFTLHDSIPIQQMINGRQGGVFFIAEPNEENPSTIEQIFSNSKHAKWKYGGNKATQYWFYPNPDKNAMGLVNGRFTYWKTDFPIPGGISFENFEIKSPFKQGEVFIFGITPLSAKEFIQQIDRN